MQKAAQKVEHKRRHCTPVFSAGEEVITSMMGTVLKKLPFNTVKTFSCEITDEPSQGCVIDPPLAALTLFGLSLPQSALAPTLTSTLTLIVSLLFVHNQQHLSQA